MIKHGYCPTCGAFTAASSYIEGIENRQEREDYLTDEEIATEVRDAIAAEGELDPKSIAVTSLNGVVTLTGQVPSKDHKRLAAELSYAIPTVLDVHNLLTISPASERAPKM